MRTIKLDHVHFEALFLVLRRIQHVVPIGRPCGANIRGVLGDALGLLRLRVHDHQVAAVVPEHENTPVVG